MKRARAMALLIGIGFGLAAWPSAATAQACKDEDSMLTESKKSLTELVLTVTHESVADFDKAYHQKNAENKLSFYGMALDGMITCLQKAEQDPSTAKADAEAYKGREATYAKLKDKVQHDHDALRDITAAGDAKKYVEKLEEAS